MVVLTVWTSNCMVFKFYARHINGRRKSHSISISLILQMILKANKLFQKHKRSDINFLSFMHSRVAFFILTTPRLIHGNTLVDDTYHCLTGQHFLQLKDAPFSSADQRPSKVFIFVMHTVSAPHKEGDWRQPTFINHALHNQDFTLIHVLNFYHTKLDYSE